MEQRLQGLIVIIDHFLLADFAQEARHNLLVGAWSIEERRLAGWVVARICILGLSEGAGMEKGKLAIDDLQSLQANDGGDGHG